MKSAGHAILRAALHLITGTTRKQRLILFGVRRSGNHALTNWLANAVEERPSHLTSPWDHPPYSHAFTSPSGQVIHLNELNELDIRSTFQLFLKVRKWTRRCKVLLISFEDVRPSAYPNFRRLSGREVHIWRDALETLSSRYHNLHQKANRGIGWSRQSCDEYFLNTLREFKNASPAHGLHIWNYNLWLTSSEYRQDFLRQLHLEFDEMPQHSAVGGGSSFHGTSGQIETELNARLRRVQPQEHWVGFLSTILERHPDLFTEDEISAGQALIQERAED